MVLGLGKPYESSTCGSRNRDPLASLRGLRFGRSKSVTQSKKEQSTMVFAPTKQPPAIRHYPYRPSGYKKMIEHVSRVVGLGKRAEKL